MSENNFESTIAQDIEALKKQFEQIKSETETFLVSAKNLSDKGANEAQELLSAAKTNWQNIVASFEASSIGKFFSQTKKKAPLKKSKSKTKAKKTAKKVTKKASRPVAKPVRSKKKK